MKRKTKGTKAEKQTKKKLTLAKERVRMLSKVPDSQLAEVAGGQGPRPSCGLSVRPTG